MERGRRRVRTYKNNHEQGSQTICNDWFCIVMLLLGLEILGHIHRNAFYFSYALREEKEKTQIREYTRLKNTGAEKLTANSRVGED